MSNQPPPIAVIPKNNRGEFIRIGLNEFKDMHFADIRVILANGADGKHTFTQKGIAIPLRRLPAVIDALQSALTKAREEGLFDRDRTT